MNLYDRLGDKLLDLNKEPGDLLEEVLVDLEGRVDPERQKRVRKKYIRALNWGPVDCLPLAVSYPFPGEQITGQSNYLQNPEGENERASLSWVYSPEERFYDPEKMFLNQLLVGFGSIYLNSEIGDQLPFTIRGNFGTVIVPSVYGAEIRFTEGNTPWASGSKSIGSYLDADPYDFGESIFERVYNRYEYYRELLSRYPRLQESVAVVLPDLQGPLEVAASLLGEELYLKMIQEPDRVWQLLRRISKTIVALAEKFKKLTREHLPDGYTHQHGAVIKGNILIREDSAINLSAERYREQVLPHNEFIVDELSGGGVHFCGDGEHLVETMASSSKVDCIDLGQPKMMDVRNIYDVCKEHRTPLIRVRFDREVLVRVNLGEEYPSGMILRHRARSVSDAGEICSRYFA